MSATHQNNLGLLKLQLIIHGIFTSMLSVPVSLSMFSYSTSTMERRAIGRSNTQLRVLVLNPCGSFLILKTLQIKIFQFSQEYLLIQTFMYDEEPSVSQDNNLQRPDSGQSLAEDSSNTLKALQGKRCENLAGRISLYFKD